jgi:hypothetical protein
VAADDAGRPVFGRSGSDHPGRQKEKIGREPVIQQKQTRAFQKKRRILSEYGNKPKEAGNGNG